MMKIKVIISCGGTGGHITPALAIADVVKDNFSGADILFIGATGGMEEELVFAAGYRIQTLDVKGLSRSAGLKNLAVLQKARAAKKEAARMLGDFCPDIVIGTGGYACYPALAAAARMHIPSAVHESNAVPGLTVRLLARRVDRVWLNFEQAREHLPASAKVLAVGNPLRRGYRTPVPAPLPPGCTRMLLSFGGSLGATEINRAVLQLMESHCNDRTLYHLHATGKREYEPFCRELCRRGLQGRANVRVVPFLSDMPQQMAAADLVICRAGAMSISELAALGKAAILIPSPNVTGDHQHKNAMLLASKGAAICLPESELAGGGLEMVTERLLREESERAFMARAITRFHNPHANACILRDILSLCRR